MSYSNLHDVVEKGNLKDVKTFLRKQNFKGVNITDWMGETALHLAARYGKTKVCKYLIEHGSEINKKTNYDVTPLMEAVEFGKHVTAKLLLEKGAETDVADDEKMAPIHRAVMNNDAKMVALLKNYGADMELKSGSKSPLLMAVKENKTDAALKLIELGAEVNTRDGSGRTILHYATKNRNLKVVQALIKNHVHVNNPDTKGRSPLQYAAQKGMPAEICWSLIDAGAGYGNVNIKTSWFKKEPLIDMLFRLDTKKTLNLILKTGLIIKKFTDDNNNEHDIYFFKKEAQTALERNGCVIGAPANCDISTEIITKMLFTKPLTKFVSETKMVMGM